MNAALWITLTLTLAVVLGGALTLLTRADRRTDRAEQASRYAAGGQVVDPPDDDPDRVPAILSEGGPVDSLDGRARTTAPGRTRRAAGRPTGGSRARAQHSRDQAAPDGPALGREYAADPGNLFDPTIPPEPGSRWSAGDPDGGRS